MNLDLDKVNKENLVPKNSMIVSARPLSSSASSNIFTINKAKYSKLSDVRKNFRHQDNNSFVRIDKNKVRVSSKKSFVIVKPDYKSKTQVLQNELREINETLK
jgi:lipopolysaccharide export LptBFGC system permease protein LptF